MSKVKFYFEDGKTKTFDVRENIIGLRHEGYRPYLAAVYGKIGNKRLEQEYLQTMIVPAIHPYGAVKIMNGLDK